MRQASTLAVQCVKDIAVAFEGDKGREVRSVRGEGEV